MPRYNNTTYAKVLHYNICQGITILGSEFIHRARKIYRKAVKNSLGCFVFGKSPNYLAKNVRMSIEGKIREI